MWGIKLLCVFQNILIYAICNIWIMLSIGSNEWFNSCIDVDNSRDVEKPIEPFKFAKHQVALCFNVS
jgi:hypothetical protein